MRVKFKMKYQLFSWIIHLHTQTGKSLILSNRESENDFCLKRKCRIRNFCTKYLFHYFDYVGSISNVRKPKRFGWWYHSEFNAMLLKIIQHRWRLVFLVNQTAKMTWKLYPFRAYTVFLSITQMNAPSFFAFMSLNHRSSASNENINPN